MPITLASKPKTESMRDAVQRLKRTCQGCGEKYPPYYFSRPFDGGGLCAECYTAALCEPVRSRLEHRAMLRAGAGYGQNSGYGFEHKAPWQTAVIGADWAPKNKDANSRAMGAIAVSFSATSPDTTTMGVRIVPKGQAGMDMLPSDYDALRAEIQHFDDTGHIHKRASRFNKAWHKTYATRPYPRTELPAPDAPVHAPVLPPTSDIS